MRRFPEKELTSGRGPLDCCLLLLGGVRRTLAATVLMLVPHLAAGQERPSPKQPLQELFFTEVVYPQERHEVQLTFGAFVDRTRADKSALAPVSVEFGLTNRWQIEAGWDGYSRYDNDPWRDLRTQRLSLGTKYSFMHIAGAPVHAAMGLDVEFTRADVFAEGEGEQGTQFEPFLALAADVPHGVTFFGSAGLSLQRAEVVDLATGQPPDDRGTLSGGLLVRIHRVTIAGEYTSRSDDAPWRLDGSPLVTPSITVHPGGEWELAAGMPIGVRSGTHRPGLAFHVVKEF